MVDGFTQEYQESVEKFVRSYRAILTFFKDHTKDPTAVNYLQQFFHWKRKEIERFQLRI